MELHRYRQEALGHCEELVSELREFGLERLHGLCVGVGAERFRGYVGQNVRLMLLYVGETRSKRKKMHPKLDADNRALFVLGALYHARCGWAFLGAVCDHGIQAGPSYRQLTAAAAEATWSLTQSSPSLWPFEEEDGLSDPFDGA